jgi:hypothetical protein
MSTRPPSLIFRGSSNSTLRNVYVPGSGVGARSIAVRRALSRRASTPRTSTTTTSSEPETIPIVITESNNTLKLQYFAVTINVVIDTGSYNTTTFLSELNTKITSAMGLEGLGGYILVVSYDTTTNKFTFFQTNYGDVSGGAVIIDGSTMDSVLGINELGVGESYPDPNSSETYESEFAVVYNP